MLRRNFLQALVVGPSVAKKLAEETITKTTFSDTRLVRGLAGFGRLDSDSKIEAASPAYDQRSYGTIEYFKHQISKILFKSDVKKTKESLQNAKTRNLYEFDCLKSISKQHRVSMVLRKQSKIEDILDLHRNQHSLDCLKDGKEEDWY